MNTVMSVGSPISAARWEEREREKKKKRILLGCQVLASKFLTRCDVAVIPSKALDSEGEWVHVPCISLGFSDSRGRCKTFLSICWERMLS